MSAISRTIDRYYALKIMTMLTRDFSEWDAFKTGIIDITGSLVKKPKTSEEKDSYTRFDAVLRSIKRVLNRFPGGAQSLARAYLTKGFLYESDFQEQMLWQMHIVAEAEDEWTKTLLPVIEALIGCNPDEPFFVDLFEEMVAGDAGGDPKKIAAGTNSGAITRAAPEVIGKKKKKVDSKTES